MTEAMAQTDWTALGRRLYDALGAVARERLDLHGDTAYGEALRLVAAARLLVTMEEHCAEVERVGSVADWNRNQAESARREHLAEVSELRRTVDRQVADRMAGLAAELRTKAEREKLGHHVRRGVLLAADWLAAPAARLDASEKQDASVPGSVVAVGTHQREDLLAGTLDLVAARVRELEGALKDLIDECLIQGDSRKPRPALARASALLWMRDRRAAAGTNDELAS